MKLLIVRHGDPDYSIDSLTPVGWQEAELLSRRLSKMDVTAFYVSPMGRAKDTAKATLEKMNREAEECPWLREFSAKIERPNREGLSGAWDWLPQDWTQRDILYDPEKWTEEAIMAAGNVREEYDWVTRKFDALLKKHGYERSGRIYRAVQPNRDTLVFFCHFGVECVLLSHLIGASPMVLWHGLCAAPTSVTTIYTEERREGIASFRVSAFGDVSHLYAAGQEPSFAARFCETFEDESERHD